MTARLRAAKRGSGDGDDAEKAASVRHVRFEPSSEVLTLSPATTSGIAPLDVTFKAETNDPGNVTRFEIDYDGDGMWDRSGESIPQDLARRYTTPGLRLATARVTMQDGSVATATAIIHVQSFITVNRLLKEVWSGFRETLAKGDVDGAMTWLVADDVREKYRRPLESIRPRLPAFAERLQSLDAVWIRGDVARYLAIRDEEGRPTGYHVYFGRDANGLWKILEF